MALVGIIFLTACRDEIILDLNTTGPVLVVEGSISNDRYPFQVKLTTTADYYSLEIPLVKDARVTISGSDGTMDTLFYNDTAGIYSSRHDDSCKVGISYTLTVVYKGTTYSASEVCRPQNPVDSLKTIFTPKRSFFPEAYYLWEWSQEKPGIGDCYQWNFFKNDTFLNDGFYILNDDALVDGQYLASDFFFPLKLNDIVTFEQFSISRQYFNYLNAVQNQINRDGSPFSAPPSNIGGNISNGALGYFSVRNIIRIRLIVK